MVLGEMAGKEGVGGKVLLKLGKGGIAFVRNYLTLDLYGAGLDLYVVGLPDDAADLEVLESDPEAGTSTVRATFHGRAGF